MFIEPAIPYRDSTMDVSRVNADGTTENLGVVASSAGTHTRADEPRFVWNGSYLVGDKVMQAPTGQYQLTVRALPVGGDKDQDSDWAQWTSPTFSIDWKTEGYIPQSELTVTSPDGAGGDAGALSDDNIFTVAEGSTESTYDIDLGGVYDVSKVHSTFEQHAATGHATRWTVQTSEDGATWSDAGSGDIEPGAFSPAILELGTAVRARYVRVSLVNGQDGATALQTAELRVAGTAAGGGADPTSAPSGSAAPADPSRPTPPDQVNTALQDPDSEAGGAAGDSASAASDKGHPFLARTGTTLVIGIVGLALVVVGGLLLVRRHRGSGDGDDGE